MTCCSLLDIIDRFFRTLKHIMLFEQFKPIMLSSICVAVNMFVYNSSSIMEQRLVDRTCDAIHLQ